MLADTIYCGARYIDITVDVDALTVSQYGSVAHKQLARFATFDALCSGYAAIWQAVVDEYGDGDARDETGDEATPMDVQAAWLRRERRAKARANHDDGVWARKLEKARAVLAAFTGQDQARAALPERMRERFDLSGKALASSLAYVIEIERDPARAPVALASRKGRGSGRRDGSGNRLPIGVSKIGGWPHLPPEQAWPEQDGEPLYLFAQLSLAEIAAADRSGLVPGRGMVYVFITENAHGRLVHVEETSALALCEPPFEDMPGYMRTLVDNEQRLTFTPAFYLRQEIGDTMGPRLLLEALPVALRERVAEALGCSPKVCDAFGGDRIFGGDPVDWQARYASYLKHELFAQLDHSEGHISVGVDPDDLRVASFDDADVAYCGT